MSAESSAVSLDPVPAAGRARLGAAAALATARGERLAWVGGGVRDLLLGRGGLDLDLVLEGDLDAYARALGARLGGRLALHPRFRTATLVLPDGARLDVARARRERYAAPALLPEVEPATLEEDLARRDFSINAIALALSPPGDLGRPLDPFDGRGDLAAARLRVLHERSFVDDPTRLLRGLRFALRFGFRFEAATEARARAAVAAGLPAALSGARLGNELRLLFEDRPEVDEALAALGAYELAGFVAPGLAEPRTLLRAIERSAAARRFATELSPRLECRGFRLALLAMAEAVGEAAAAELAARLELPRAERALAAAGPARVAGAAAALSICRPPHAAAEWLAPLAGEELALVAAAGELPAAWVRRWLTELRHLRPALTGADLIAAGVPPGARLGRALRETRRARLDGVIGPGEELAFALRSAAGEGEPR